MKKIAIILYCTCNALPGFSQDESYRGGIADGHASVSQVSAFGNPTSFQPYFGGNADGHAADSIINFLQALPPLLFAPFYGGNADGHATDSIIVFTQHAYIPIYQPYSGGQADGWTGFPIFGVTIVPINLLSFAGEQKDKKHLLHWTTTQEQNTSHFDIERSADGRKFSKIGKTSAAGNSASLRNYDFTDAIPAEGNNFYRLNMFDADGSSKYSNIILLKVQGNKATMAIYPNPTAKTLNVLLGGLNDNSTVNATVFDANGKEIQSVTLKKANSSFGFDVEHLPAGLYVLRVIWNNETSVWRFIKQ